MNSILIYFFKYVQHVIIYHIIGIKIIEIFYISFFTLSLQNSVYILYSQHISFRLVMVPVLNSYVWLVVTHLGRTNLHSNKFSVLRLTDQCCLYQK